MNLFSTPPPKITTYEEVFQRVCAEYGATLVVPDGLHPPLVQAVAETIHTSFFEPTCTPERLYRQFGIGDTGFSTCFGHYLGRSVCDYINYHRRELAKRLLGVEGLRIGQIALMVGFETTGALSMSFRRHEGCTPSAYRRYAAEKGKKDL